MNRILLLLSLFFNLTCTQDYTRQASIAIQEKNGDRAISLLTHALQENPNDGTALLQMATVQFLTHQYKTAAQYYEKAIELNPSHSNARYNCATAHSRFGNFSRALELYKQVHEELQDEKTKGTLFKMYVRCQQWDPAIQLQTPSLWWYDENIFGKTILLDCCKPGNGLGDVIQFIRYAQTLTQAGARILVKAPLAVHPLFAQCTFIDTLLKPDDPPPFYDRSYDICIASLLLKAKDRIAMNTPQAAYLSADPHLVTAWRKKISQDDTFKVGLCWKSNLVRDLFTGNIISSPRSLSLKELAPLSDLNVSFYSLQKMSESIDAPFAITQFNEDFDDSHGRFMDTAALIMNMDLIITVDTSIAHLAGALGKKVWLLLSCESDYRWFTDSDHSPLYPNMRLFRQSEYREWDTIIKTVHTQLQKQITSPGSIS